MSKSGKCLAALQADVAMDAEAIHPMVTGSLGVSRSVGIVGFETQRFPEFSQTDISAQWIGFLISA